MADIAVEFKDVQKRFGDFVAVDGVSFEIERGEFLTLLGPSGCGKTTLLRMLAGFESVSDGDILINGQSVVDTPPYERPIGMVFQNLALFPHLTAGDNIAFGLRLKSFSKKEISKKVDEAMELVGLPGQQSKRIGQLSGGQRQRIALARSLVIGPAVLLLDEPLSALDLKLRRQMQIELKTIQRRSGTTFVFVTHDQEEALMMSDRIAVMNKGHVEQLDSAGAIYHYPKTPFAANFVGEMNFLPCHVVASDEAGVTVRLEASSGLVGPIRTNARFEVGAPVFVCARPENVRFSAVGDKEDGIKFSARMLKQHYSGSTVRYDLDAGGVALIVRSASDPDVDSMVPDGMVTVMIGQSHLRVVARPQ